MWMSYLFAFYTKLLFSPYMKGGLAHYIIHFLLNYIQLNSNITYLISRHKLFYCRKWKLKMIKKIVNILIVFYICAQYILEKCVFMIHPKAVPTSNILLYFFFLDLGYIHTYYVHLRWNTRDTEIVQYMWNIRIWVYTLVIVLFLSPIILNFFFLILFTIEFLVLRVVEKIYRTPSNQWIPLPYYGCLLYIKKRNSVLTIIYHISFSDYNNMCVLWCATSALLLSILNKNSIFLNRSFSPRFNVLFVFCMSYVKSFRTIRVSIRWFSNRN